MTDDRPVDFLGVPVARNEAEQALMSAAIGRVYRRWALRLEAAAAAAGVPPAEAYGPDVLGDEGEAAYWREVNAEITAALGEDAGAPPGGHVAAPAAPGQRGESPAPSLAPEP